MAAKNTFQIFLILLLGILLSCNTNDDSNNTPPDDVIDEEGIELYYYSKRNAINNIYKSDLQGNETPIIIDNNHHDWWIRVSPNHQKILWYKSPLNVASNQEFNNYEEAELWLANSDGSNPQKIIDLSDYNWIAQGVADWSPDGTQIVMAGKDSNNYWQIYITDNNGENPVKISQDADKDYADPSWSPDGEKIVFSKFIGLNLEVHIMDKDGSNEVQLTNDDAYQNFDAYWSPDGKEIAFESKWSILDCYLLGKWAIRKYNFETGLTTDVLKDDNINGLARWTNDSNNIYFSLLVCGEYGRLAKMNRDGSNIEIVLEDANFPYYDCDLME